MFSRIIKEFFLKKIVNKKLSNYKSDDVSEKISSVGIIIDESNFDKTQKLISILKQKGFKEKNIVLLTFKDRISKKDVLSEPFYSPKDITLKGEITKEELNQFIDTSFDLLINYYEFPKASLNIIAKKSKAKFKVGFSTIDKRINHMMIDTTVDQYEVFINELTKYLIVLNKI